MYYFLINTLGFCSCQYKIRCHCHIKVYLKVNFSQTRSPVRFLIFMKKDIFLALDIFLQIRCLEWYLNLFVQVGAVWIFMCLKKRFLDDMTWYLIIKKIRYSYTLTYNPANKHTPTQLWQVISLWSGKIEQ